jgi:ABC-2 type transport system ATP-binding protein
MSWVIETDNLGKNYGRVKAVEHLSLRVAEGEIYAFLGLNGAGKTTTIRLLLGMIKPSNGYAQVFGTRVRLGSTIPWASVGYMVEDPRAYAELTVYENLEAARRLHPGTPSQAVSQVIDRLDLGAYTHRKAGTLSHGNAQRLGLAKAMLHNPQLLILDEPANGLDPAGIVEIRQLLHDWTGRQGGTVFMSSHILAEVSRLANRIGIIHQGHLLQEMDIAELERNRRRRLLVDVADAPAALQLLSASGQPANHLQGGTLELLSPYAISHPAEINRLLVDAAIFPSRLVVDEEELEHYFLRLVRASGAQGNE